MRARERWSRLLLRIGRERAGLRTRRRIAVRPGEDGDWAVALDWSPALNLTPSDATDAPTTPAAGATPTLDHERLDCFHVALEFAAMIPTLTKAARPALRDQLERASSSIALTLAEGCARRTRRDRHRFFAISQGSAMECAAAIDILRVTGGLAAADATRAKHKIARIVQMLVGLRRR
jgi:four helix bundle protein